MRGASRLSNAEDRVDSQKLWRDNIEKLWKKNNDTCDAQRLISSVLQHVMADDTPPLRIKRLCKLAPYATEFANSRINQWSADPPPTPPDLTCANAKSKLIDAAFESVLVPLLRSLKSPEFRAFLLAKRDWFQESAAVAAQRAALDKRISDINVAGRTLEAVEEAVRRRSVPPARPSPAGGAGWPPEPPGTSRGSRSRRRGP